MLPVMPITGVLFSDFDLFGLEKIDNISNLTLVKNKVIAPVLSEMEASIFVFITVVWEFPVRDSSIP